jgi:hypothetical protein
MVNSRQKGKQFEYKICKKLEEITNRKWTTSPQSGGVATRTGNLALAGDILPKNFKCDYVFECKKYKEIRLEELLKGTGNLPKWVKQLEREKGNRPGILIWSENYGKIYCMAEHKEYIEGTFRYGKYLIGLFDDIMPKILSKYVKEK